MSLNIKNEAVVSVVRQLAGATGETMTSAIEHAVREKLVRLREEEGPSAEDRARSARVDALVERLQELARDSPMTRERADAELYDERGLLR